MIRPAPKKAASGRFFFMVTGLLHIQVYFGFDVIGRIH